MNRFKVAVVKKQIKYVTVLADNETDACHNALMHLMGKEFSNCFIEYSTGDAIPAGDDAAVDVLPVKKGS